MPSAPPWCPRGSPTSNGARNVGCTGHRRRYRQTIPRSHRRPARRHARRPPYGLADPTTELMAEVFNLLQVDLIRVEGRTFEGVARIPIPDPDSGAEVWEGALQDPLSNLPWSAMRVPFPISVDLPVRWVAE